MLAEVVVVWRKFCIQLIPHITEDDIKIIVAGDSPDDCLTNLLSTWIQANPRGATIDELVKATREISNDLTTMICDKDEMRRRYPGIGNDTPLTMLTMIP